MNDKISVREYLEDKTLLDVVYIPYIEKAKIIKSIKEELLSDGVTFDKYLFKKFLDTLFIGLLTNIELSDIDEETNLDGYDLLFFYDSYGVLIDSLGEQYKLFTELYEIGD